MDALPHEYDVSVSAAVEGGINAQCPGAPGLTVNTPAQFGGPGDAWSPETLFLAAIANCFVLTFRAVSQASRLQWQNLDCRAVGVLDKQGGKMRFTEVELTAELSLAEGEAQDKALRLMQKAEENCLVSNSLAMPVKLVASIVD
jgi:peroxiredoxin-like protein